MDTKGLLFIPDISGFSRFVTETEIDHSRQIIQELLEVVIDSDRMGLQISEIEGDAVLFFGHGARARLPDDEEKVDASVPRAVPGEAGWAGGGARGLERVLTARIRARRRGVAGLRNVCTRLGSKL
jgi:hypothetical protein